MRDPREWDEDYLLSNLPLGEFDWLEVKGRRALDLTLSNVKEHQVKENLSKALSAFANTGGGAFVLGLSDPSDSWQIDDGGVDLHIKGGTREWLEDIIPTLTDYPITDFNVYLIKAISAASHIGVERGLFVIEIGDSEHAPHQAVDNRYYARVGGKSRPIGHRLVVDIANRRQDPIIELSFEIEWEKRYPVVPFPGHGESVYPILKIQSRNNGRVMAEYLNCFIFIPSIMSTISEEHREEVILDGKHYVRKYFSNQLDNGQFLKGASAYWFDPVLPGRGFTWQIALNREQFNSNPPDLEIVWKVSADNAPMRKGALPFDSVPVINKEADAV